MTGTDLPGASRSWPSVDVVPDTAWAANFPKSQQRLVASLTGPIRRRYGYPIRAEK